MIQLSGQHTPFWMSSTSEGQFRPLTHNVFVDVAIVGGGIAGLTAAFLLKRAGKKVAVIEAEAIASKASGRTTAKITSLHQLVYAELIEKYGEAKARIYAESNQAALEQIVSLIKEEKIDCDFSRQDAYTFAESADNLDKIKAEAEAAIALGLPASFVDKTPLPFGVAGAVKFTDQAQFHIRKYLVALAEKIDGNGSYVFELSRVTSVESDEPCVVKAENGTVKAQDVIVTTNLPITDEGLFFAKTSPKRSYIVAAKIDQDKAPDGMFIGCGDSYRSIRTAPDGDDLLLLIGGEGHQVGDVTETEERYLALEEYGHEQFGIETYDYRWSGQDLKSRDGLPYIGNLTDEDEHIFIATGFSLWGVTNGTLAGMLLCDRLVGKENPWAELYDATRPVSFLDEEKKRKELFGDDDSADDADGDSNDKSIKINSSHLKEVGNGEGKVLSIDDEKVAIYRDENGKAMAMSAVCPHLGCTVNWNSAEKSWDCPCHGGRYDSKGAVINAPAVKDLKVLDCASS
ncbi:FAD-dependent oxidoreductase [[Limnothrix rosea] IAM M-220]|uniref:FAD-dependent oxidoreductase n=1 Tax=[Limnothrix rosea] IAM M-220 TaxID=454133 RepID=UPI000965C146|nr:FAD-dependent oxidoreductase [[Limnothrix rosea] IAM M-220]OKH13774.1 (2Fe-2S)-binding protein [[Limnothrix rosea] IAM M-220]